MIYSKDIKSKSELINSEPDKHKKEKDIRFEEHEIIEHQNNEVEYILKDTIKDCRKKCFQTFVYGCVYDIKYKTMENNEEVFLSITLEYMNFKSQFFRIKEIKNSAKISFSFNDISQLTIKFFSILSKKTYVVI